MRETITDYITYSTVVYEKFEDGAKIECTTVEHQVQLSKNQSNETVATIVVSLDKIGINTSTVFEASLVMELDDGVTPMNNTEIRFTVYADGECLEEESTTQSGSTLVIPLTNWIQSAKNEMKIVLELENQSEEHYSVSQRSIALDISYNDALKRTHNKRSFPLVCGAREHVDLFTGDSVTEFPVIADENMGVTVSGIIKASDEDFHCGENVRLSINEKLIKNTETEIESDYLYTDSLGDKHLFKETLYYVKNGVKKIITDKSQIEITPDGELLYNDGTQIFEVKRKEASYCGLKATTKLEGFKSIDLFDSRIDEEKELEERIDSYKNVLEQLVIVNNDGEVIMEMQEDLSNAGELKAEIEAEGVKHLLTKDEFNSFKSIIAQIEENSRNSKLVQNSIATSKQSLKNTLNSLYDTKNALLLQKAKLDNVGTNSTAVQSNRYIYVNRQIETIQSKSGANLSYLKYLYQLIVNSKTSVDVQAGEMKIADIYADCGSSGKHSLNMSLWATTEEVQKEEKMNDNNIKLFESYVLNVKGYDAFHTLNIVESGNTYKIQLNGAGNLYDNLDSVINSVSSSNVLVLTRAEADSLYALRKEKLLISRAQGDTRRNSSLIDSYINIVEQSETVSAQIGIVSGQLAALEKGNGVYKESWGDLLVQEKNLAEQRILLDEQLEIIKSRSAENIETFLKYYKEYLLLVDKHKDLKMQMPVNYIVGENGAKGFNENGDLVAIYDKHGKYIAFEYEAYYVGTEKRYRVARIVDDKENEIVFSYNENGLLSEISDSKDRITKYEYIYDASTRKYVFDSVTYFDGTFLRKSEDSIGMTVLSTEHELSQLGYSNSKLSYAGNFRTVNSISHNNIDKSEFNKFISGVSIRYDENSVKALDNLGSGYEYKFNLNGQIIEEYEITNGIVTSAAKYSYDANKLISVSYPTTSCLNVKRDSFVFTEEYTKSLEYDSFDRLVSDDTKYIEVTVGTHRGINNVYTYDENDRLIKKRTEITTWAGVETNTDYAVEAYEYDNSDRLLCKKSYTEEKELTEGITVEEHIYDKNGYETKTVTYNSLDPSSKLYKEYEVNEDGETVGEFDQSGMFKTVFEGNTSVKPNGAKFSVGADILSGNSAITMSTENGEENSIQRLYTNGLLTRVISGDCTYDYTYDHRGRVTAVRINGEPHITYTYDDNVEETVDGIIQYVNKVTTTHANGDTVIAVSDLFGNVFAVYEGHYNDDEFIAELSVTNKFDDNQRVTEKIDTSINDCVSHNYEYDEKNRITSYERNVTLGSALPYSEAYTYDNYGNLIERTVNFDSSRTNTTTYEYDNQTQKLKAITCAGSARIEPKLDCLGRNRGKTVSWNETKVYSEDITYLKQGDHATVLPLTVSYGRKTSNGFAIKENVKYKYDSMGNITNVYENGQLVVEYKYDALSRLVRENNKKLGKTFVFSYDNMGNILTRTEYPFTLVCDNLLNDLTGEVFEYGYDNGMLVYYNGESILYGTVGIPAMYRGNTLSWGLGNRLTGYGSNTFAYDAKGKRKAKNSIKYIYDIGDKLIRMENTNSGEYINFIYDNSSIIGFVHNENHYFYKKDLLCNVTEILDINGNTMVKYTYDAWGNHTITDNSGFGLGDINPFRYRGYYYDTETGLYYLKSRYYDPQTGRFISMDSIDYLDPETIGGANLYAYCGNNPVMYMDLKGCKYEWIGWLISGLEVVLGTVLIATGVGAIKGFELIGVGAGSIISALVNTANNEGAFWSGWTGGQVSGLLSLIPGVNYGLSAFAGSVVADLINSELKSVNLEKAVATSIIGYAFNAFPLIAKSIMTQSGVYSILAYTMITFDEIVISTINSVVDAFWKG